jgi:hypothetical protein
LRIVFDRQFSQLRPGFGIGQVVSVMPALDGLISQIDGAFGHSPVWHADPGCDARYCSPAPLEADLFFFRMVLAGLVDGAFHASIGREPGMRFTGPDPVVIKMRCPLEAGGVCRLNDLDLDALVLDGRYFRP